MFVYGDSKQVHKYTYYVILNETYVCTHVDIYIECTTPIVSLYFMNIAKGSNNMIQCDILVVLRFSIIYYIYIYI